MADTAIRAPRSLTEAQRLCEQWAELDGEIAAIEESRERVAVEWSEALLTVTEPLPSDEPAGTVSRPSAMVVPPA